MWRRSEHNDVRGVVHLRWGALYLFAASVKKMQRATRWRGPAGPSHTRAQTNNRVQQSRANLTGRKGRSGSGEGVAVLRFPSPIIGANGFPAWNLLKDS